MPVFALTHENPGRPVRLQGLKTVSLPPRHGMLPRPRRTQRAKFSYTRTESAFALVGKTNARFRSHTRESGSPGPAAGAQNRPAPPTRRTFAPAGAHAAANFSYTRTESGFALT